jgi:hypothetical protein
MIAIVDSDSGSSSSAPLRIAALRMCLVHFGLAQCRCMLAAADSGAGAGGGAVLPLAPAPTGSRCDRLRLPAVGGRLLHVKRPERCAGRREKPVRQRLHAVGVADADRHLESELPRVPAVVRAATAEAIETRLSSTS